MKIEHLKPTDTTTQQLLIMALEVSMVTITIIIEKGFASPSDPP